MPYYSYTAKDSQGNITKGEVFALDTDVVAEKIVKEKLTPIKITVINKKKAEKKKSLKQILEELLSPSVKPDDLIIFSKQMHAMLRAGVPILRAVKASRTATKSYAMRKILDEMVAGLEAGKSVVKSLEPNAHMLPTLFLSLLEAGENSGNLDIIFKQLAEYMDRDKATKNRIKEATRYPMFVIAAIVAAIFIVSIFVIPNFENLFRKFGSDLPLPTVILIAVSGFMQAYWPHVIAGFFIILIVIKRLLRKKKFRRYFDTFKLKLPVLGELFFKSLMERFGRSFNLMYESGVPLLQVLVICSKVVDNDFVGEKIMHMKADVERGESIAKASKKAKLFTPLVMQMIMIGEETGEVQKMLMEVAQQYSDEVEYDLKALSSAIEPVMILAMSGIVLILLLGIFLPMWDIMSIAQ